MYLAQNKLPHTKVAIREVEMLAERYILLDSLLFKIHKHPRERISTVGFNQKLMQTK